MFVRVLAVAAFAACTTLATAGGWLSTPRHAYCAGQEIGVKGCPKAKTCNTFVSDVKSILTPTCCPTVKVCKVTKKSSCSCKKSY